MSSHESIWFKDPRGFLQEGNLGKFIPWTHTTTAEKLNAIMRFALYYGLVIFVFQRSFIALYIPLVTAIVTYLVYENDRAVQKNLLERMDALDVSRGVTGRICTKPTRNNPFMNVLVSDYSRFPEKPGACDLGAKGVTESAERMFSRNLYSDSDDVYDRNTNSRQFYTNATTTIPNDQEGFARWLYGTGPTCKEGNGDMCATGMIRYVPGL